MRVKVCEMTDGNNKWYLLYDKKDEYQNGIYNNGYEEVDLPDCCTLLKGPYGRLYIYINGYPYNINKDKKGYILYPD